MLTIYHFAFILAAFWDLSDVPDCLSDLQMAQIAD